MFVRFIGSPVDWRSWIERLISVQARSVSATPHACAKQPRDVCGASPSKISLIEPTHASLRVRRHRGEPRQRGGRIAIDAVVRQRERSEQPRPHRALVIDGVALARAAAIATRIRRVVRRRGCAVRTKSTASRAHASTTDFARAGVEQVDRQRHREDLVWAEACVVAVVGRVDDVVQISAGFVPETRAERRAHLRASASKRLRGVRVVEAARETRLSRAARDTTAR